MRVVVLLLIASLLLLPVFAQTPGEAVPMGPVPVDPFQPASLVGPAIEAEGAVLLDGASGRVLWEKNGRQPFYPASTTKVMTAILALENLSLDEPVTVSKEAAFIGEQSMGLAEGEVRSVGELLYGALLHSGNDAAQALADHLAAKYNVDFVQWMNRRAKELGAQGSHFVNPHGLHNPDHYSTPYDLAILTRHGIYLPEFTKITSTKVKNLPWPGKPYEMTLINQNKMLWRYPGVDGGKTGYTQQAGNTLVVSAVRGDTRLVAAILKSPHIFDDAKALFDFGFAHFSSVTVDGSTAQGLQVSVSRGLDRRAPVRLAVEPSVAVTEEEKDKLSLETHLAPVVAAPVSDGQEVGQAVVLLDGKALASYPLVAASAVGKRQYLHILWDMLRWASGPLTP